MIVNKEFRMKHRPGYKKYFAVFNVLCTDNKRHEIRMVIWSRSKAEAQKEAEMESEPGHEFVRMEDSDGC